MKLEEAIQLFDLVDPTDAVGIPTCCNLPVVQNSQDGISRISCLECGREIQEVGRQWVVSDWGRKGINLLRLSAPLQVQASRNMAQTAVPEALDLVSEAASADECRRFDKAVARLGEIALELIKVGKALERKS